MSWAPNDLVTDADLLAYERRIFDQFNVTDWQDRRQKAIEDWLFPLLEVRGFNPLRFRTRFAPIYAVGTTSSVTTDKTTAASTENGLVLSAILATSSDYLYLGYDQPFRGLSVRQSGTVNAVAGALTVALWADTWRPVTVTNTTLVGTASFGRGGAITWTLPESIVRRSVNGTGPAYWVRLSLASAPTSGTVIGPVAVIRRSRLCAAVTMRTLALIFREAPIAQDGPWEARALWYEREAEQAWLRVADQIGGEFDADDDDAIDATEANQTALDASGGGWRWERG